MGRSIPRPIPAHRVDSHTLGSWATYLPRVLVALAVVIFVAMQLGGSPLDSGSKAGKLNAVTGGKSASAHGSGSSSSSSSSSSKRGKDAAASSSESGGEKKKTRPPRTPAAAPSREGMLCYENDLLEGCRNWLDVVLARERFDLVLVANELYPTFPLKGYGGIETAVEILANALSRMNIPFWVIAPGRVTRPEYPFDVMEALDSSNGRPHMVGTFVNQAIDIIRWRADYVGAKLTLIEKLHEKVGSAPPPPNEKNRTLVIWGQSEWSQEFAPFSAVTITAHHDGGGPLKGWDRHLDNVGHRFLSHDQRDQWVNPDDSINIKRTRVIPHGLPPDDFMLCADEGYYLWVASLDWGWIEKGLDIFTDLARIRPDLKFVAYGAYKRRQDIRDKLVNLATELPNFEFRGELKRGPEHRDIFCGATAFFMPTHESIGESFGMTVIESLSKGVPVIASINGAVPEILDIRTEDGQRADLGSSPYGHTCKTLFDYELALNKTGTRTTESSKKIQAYAKQRFDSTVVVDEMLKFTADLLEERESRLVALQVMETRKLERGDAEFSAAAARLFIEKVPRTVFDLLRAKGAVGSKGELLKAVSLNDAELVGLDSATLIGLTEHGFLREE